MMSEYAIHKRFCSLHETLQKAGFNTENFLYIGKGGGGEGMKACEDKGCCEINMDSSTACQIFDVRTIFLYAQENGFLRGKK